MTKITVKVDGMVSGMCETNINEMIKKDAKKQVEFMELKIKNDKKNIGYIYEADHSYRGKEEILAKEISCFLAKDNKNKKYE